MIHSRRLFFQAAAGKLDVESLVEQFRFIHRGRVHGFVWPQLASEWSTLSESERMEGAEALGAACRGPTPMRRGGTPSTRRRWARMRSWVLKRFREHTGSLTLAAQ